MYSQKLSIDIHVSQSYFTGGENSIICLIVLYQ